MTEKELENQIQDIVKGERTFLHDISNQLVVAQGMGAFVLKKLIADCDKEDEKKINRLEKSLNACNKMIDLVKNRRSLLHSLSDDL